MKKRKLFHFALITFTLLLQQINSYAQIKDVEWSQPMYHPCYKGLSISVLNMGWSKDVKAYLWGVRIKNNYNTTVSFRYLLNVGDEKKIATKYYYDAAYKLKPGDTISNGGNVFTAIIFKTAAADWTVMVGDVCFDEMRCGSPDDCYADCDVVARTINQPCGLSAHTSPNAPANKIEPSALSGTQEGPKKEEEKKPDMGETSDWIRDDKKVEVVMGKTEKGIYWKEKNNKEYVFFEKMPTGVYRYEVGKNYYILQFTSPTKLGFLENGTVVNYYTLVGGEEKKQEISTPGNSEWKYIHNEKMRDIIFIVDEGLIKSYKGLPSSAFFKKITENIYEKKWTYGGRAIIEFAGDNKFIMTQFNPKGKKINDLLYELVSSGVQEKEPKTTAQSTPAIDIKGKWNYEGLGSFSELQLTANGGSLYASFSYPGSTAPDAFKNFPYTKTSQYIYTYKTDSSESVLRYLNETTLSISYQHKNLKTLSYYTRPAAAPVVKQENNQEPATENKTTGESMMFDQINTNGYSPQSRKIVLVSDGLINFYDNKEVKFKKISENKYITRIPMGFNYSPGCQIVITFINKDNFIEEFSDCAVGKVAQPRLEFQLRK